MRLLAERLLHDADGTTYVDGELIRKKLKPLPPPKHKHKFHICCSRCNPGAAALMVELVEQRGFQLQLSDAPFTDAARAAYAACAACATCASDAVTTASGAEAVAVSAAASAAATTVTVRDAPAAAAATTVAATDAAAYAAATTMAATQAAASAAAAAASAASVSAFHALDAVAAQALSDSVSDSVGSPQRTVSRGLTSSRLSYVASPLTNAMKGRSSRTEVLYVTLNMDQLAECDHMLLYLTSQTWTRARRGERSTGGRGAACDGPWSARAART
jgi:hypothetical protein